MRRRDAATNLAGKRIIFVLGGQVMGGAERIALDLAVDLRRVEGAVVEICALDDREGRAHDIAAEEGIPWTSLPTPWVGGDLAKARSLVRVARGLRRLRPDILMPSTNLPNVVCGVTWNLTGARLCVWNQLDVGGTTRIRRSLFRRALHLTPIAVTGAVHGRDWLVEQWGADPRRVHVVYSRLELPPAREGREAWRARLGVSSDDLAACMLAHFTVGKDHPTLLRAWRTVVDRLAADGQKAILLLAGRQAGTEDAVKALAFDLDLRDHVRFLGDVEDISGLLGAVDFGVFTSHGELFPRGATEPMNAGLTVVGTDIPGIAEAVGEPGRLFLAAPRDVQGLGDAILRVARDPDLRESVGRANAELIRARQSAEATSRIYAALLARRLSGAPDPDSVEPTSLHRA